MTYEQFQATEQARNWKGDEYADYIQSKLVEYIERGIRTLEETQALSIGDLFVGNDGE
jgi:predicted alpha/beta superfamily hydrolase